jgi:hypothetical protein
MSSSLRGACSSGVSGASRGLVTDRFVANRMVADRARATTANTSSNDHRPSHHIPATGNRTPSILGTSSTSSSSSSKATKAGNNVILRGTGNTINDNSVINGNSVRATRVNAARVSAGFVSESANTGEPQQRRGRLNFDLSKARQSAGIMRNKVQVNVKTRDTAEKNNVNVVANVVHTADQDNVNSVEDVPLKESGSEKVEAGTIEGENAEKTSGNTARKTVELAADGSVETAPIEESLKTPPTPALTETRQDDQQNVADATTSVNTTGAATEAVACATDAPRVGRHDQSSLGRDDQPSVGRNNQSNNLGAGIEENTMAAITNSSRGSHHQEETERRNGNKFQGHEHSSKTEHTSNKTERTNEISTSATTIGTMSGQREQRINNVAWLVSDMARGFVKPGIRTPRERDQAWTRNEHRIFEELTQTGRRKAKNLGQIASAQLPHDQTASAQTPHDQTSTATLNFLNLVRGGQDVEDIGREVDGGMSGGDAIETSSSSNTVTGSSDGHVTDDRWKVKDLVCVASAMEKSKRKGDGPLSYQVRKATYHAN